MEETRAPLPARRAAKYAHTVTSASLGAVTDADLKRRSSMPAPKPVLYVIAGCNGAGKTTFAKVFLPEEVKCLRFLKGDEIARGLSPLKPSASAVQAARLLLKQVDDCVRRREIFALENAHATLAY